MERMRDVAELPTQKGKKPNEPLMPVDDYLIPFLPDRGTDICGIGGCNLSVKSANQTLWSVIPKRTKPLCHRKCRTYFPIQQGNKPLFLLLHIAIASQNL
jgi:hypothetical protein